jgi:hypothetical protein
MYIINIINLFINWKFIDLANITHFPNQIIQMMCY